MFGFKSVIAAATVATMVATSAFAAEGALSTGKPAGVQPAQQIGTGTLIVGGAAVAVLTAIAIVVSNQSGDRSAPTTFGPAATSGTPNTP